MGFWASSRTDIFVGTVSSGKIALTLVLENLKQANSSLYPNIKDQIPNLQTSIVRSFLTGFTAKIGN